MDFFFFLLVNAALLLRPAELFTQFQDVPVYLYTMIPCLVLSLPALLGLLLPGSPLRHPACLMVLGILGSVGVSHLIHSDAGRAWDETIEFGKVVVYFALLISVVNTPGRMRWFLIALIGFALITTTVALLHYHNMLEVRPKAISTAVDERIDTSGNRELIHRLQLTGILQDPNEYCVLLGVMVLLTLYQLTNSRAGDVRYLWIIPLAVLLYGIVLTFSRGGQLALFIGLLAAGVALYGVRGAVTFGLLFVPILAFAFLSRQSADTLETSTSQTRIQMWSDWLARYIGSPLVGVGPEVVPLDKDQRVVNEGDLLAHNSFIQAFADLGTFGGLCFWGAFFFGIGGLARYGWPSRPVFFDPEMERLFPFLLGAVCVYAVGLMTLSLCYIVPTYLVLGLPVAYSQIAKTWPDRSEISWTGPRLGAWFASALGFLAVIYLVVRLFRNY